MCVCVCVCVCVCIYIYIYILFPSQLAYTLFGVVVSHRIVRATALKKINPRLKVMVAVGGRSAPTRDVSVMMRQRRTRAAFARHCVAFLRKLDIDGLDLSFESPRSGHCLAIARSQFSFLVKVCLIDTGVRQSVTMTYYSQTLQS